MKKNRSSIKECARQHHNATSRNDTLGEFGNMVLRGSSSPGNNNNKLYVLDLRGIFVAFTLTTLAGHNIVFHL